MSPYGTLDHLSLEQTLLVSGVVMVIITSFGYAAIVLTLRTYLKNHINNALRLTIAIGEAPFL